MQIKFKTETQNTRLLNYLLSGKSIDPLEAWKRLGIYRLAARVFDLRQLGHEIKMTDKIVMNNFGEECRIANYKIEK